MKAIIQTPTPEIEKSKEFYKGLAFKPVSEDPAIFADGKVFVAINDKPGARVAVKFFVDEPDELSKELEKIGALVVADDGIHTADPNGVRVILTGSDFPYDSEGESFGETGNFAGISIEAVDFDATIEFWKSLGYEKTMGDEEQGWVAFANDTDIGISIMKSGMCPHLFFNPGLTYFNSGKNEENIARLRDAGIPITEEITLFNDEGKVDNVIINDPGGLGFFVFND